MIAKVLLLAIIAIGALKGGDCSIVQAPTAAPAPTAVPAPQQIQFPISSRITVTSFWQAYDDGNWPDVAPFQSNCCVSPGDDTNIHGDYSYGSAYWIQATATMDDGTHCEVHQRYVLAGGSSFCRPRLYYDTANQSCYLKQDPSC